MHLRFKEFALGMLAVTGLLFASSAMAQDKAADSKIEMAGGKIIMKAPAEWKSVPKKNNVIAYEFAGPADADKEKMARITISTSGGGLDMNLSRWYGQFEQPDGSKSADKAKVEKFEAAGQTVHLVELKGTFGDTGGAGPFQNVKPVKRENYELLGGIIETKEMGMHFVKITGPAESVDKLKEGLRKMLESMEVKK